MNKRRVMRDSRCSSLFCMNDEVCQRRRRGKGRRAQDAEIFGRLKISRANSSAADSGGPSEVFVLARSLARVSEGPSTKIPTRRFARFLFSIVCVSHVAGLFPARGYYIANIARDFSLIILLLFLKRGARSHYALLLFVVIITAPVLFFRPLAVSTSN